MRCQAVAIEFLLVDSEESQAMNSERRRCVLQQEQALASGRMRQ